MRSIIGLSLVSILLIGLQVNFQPVHVKTKSAMDIQLQTMLDQCKDVSQCQAIKNVLARTLAQEH